MSLESIKTNKKNITYAVILLIFFSVILYMLAIKLEFHSKNILGLLSSLLGEIIIIFLAFLIVFIFYAIKGEDDE
jgi:purine-cytosine permease-like protein